MASALGYTVGTKIILAHGLASTSFTQARQPTFRCRRGSVAATGTPVDQTIHVRLEGIEAMHAGGSNRFRLARLARQRVAATTDFSQPESITAFMLGLKSRLSTFNVQRQINQFKGEPLMAILPGVALSELWQMMSIFENVLRLISALVLLAAVLGMGAVLLSSIQGASAGNSFASNDGGEPACISFVLIEMEAVILSARWECYWVQPACIWHCNTC